MTTALAVSLTVEELRALVREEVREAMSQILDPSTERRELTEEDLARARKSLRRFGMNMTRREPCVYFVQGDSRGAIKIGTSVVGARHRLGDIQNGTHERLSILAEMPGSYAEERRLHKRFAHLHIRGEWFKPEPELLEFIAEISKVQT